MAKISVSLDDALLERIRDNAPGRNVSGFLAEAAERELRRRALRAYVEEVEAETGPLTEKELEEGRRWLSSLTRPS